MTTAAGILYIAVGSGEIRMKAGSVGISASDQPQKPQITEGQALHRAALSSPHLREALKLSMYPKCWGSRSGYWKKSKHSLEGR